MANSSDVSAGTDATTTQYNNLRADVLDETTGHEHTGSGDGNLIPTAGIEYDAITVDKLAHNIDATGIGFDADKVDGYDFGDIYFYTF